MFQQLEMPLELVSDLRDNVDWDKKWLVDFNSGKTQLVSFDRSNNSGAVGLLWKKNHLLRCCDCLSLLNRTGVLKLSLLLKLPPRKLEP